MKVDIPIVGDVKDVLIELIAMIRESGLTGAENPLAAHIEVIAIDQGVHGFLSLLANSPAQSRMISALPLRMDLHRIL